MSERTIAAVLFDFDMTLIDSSYAIADCTNRLARAMGLREVSREEVLGVIGLPIEDSWIALWGHSQPEWLDYYRGHFRNVEQDGFREFPGTRSLPTALRAEGIRTGVVSNRRFARTAVEKCGIAELFDTIVGLEDVTHPKPDPESLFVALDRLGVAPDRALYVGDTDIDMKTAAAAGVRGVGMTTGHFRDAALRAAGAAWTCGDLREILHLLRQEDGHCETIAEGDESTKDRG